MTKPMRSRDHLFARMTPPLSSHQIRLKEETFLSVRLGLRKEANLNFFIFMLLKFQSADNFVPFDFKKRYFIS